MNNSKCMGTRPPTRVTGAAESARSDSSENISDAVAAITPDFGERYRGVLLEAVRIFGPYEGARFMTTRNFALGGQTPAELAASIDGTRQVYNELSAQEHDGPI
jgi:Protein of unknown function (DUF2384)